MKIMICTSRIRPDGLQTSFPPYGSLAIIQALMRAGYTDSANLDRVVEDLFGKIGRSVVDEEL